MTSAARSAAARENGSKSRGPVTPEGKAIVADNPTTHGRYRRRDGAIMSGPFAEDADEWRDYCEGIVAAYFPRDVLEVEQAWVIAGIQRTIYRVETWDTAALGKAMRPARSRPGRKTDAETEAEDAAERALDRCQKTTKLFNDLQRRLDRALAVYARLRKREFVEDDDEGPDDVESGRRDPIPDEDDLRANVSQLLEERAAENAAWVAAGQPSDWSIRQAADIETVSSACAENVDPSERIGRGPDDLANDDGGRPPGGDVSDTALPDGSDGQVLEMTEVDPATVAGGVDGVDAVLAEPFDLREGSPTKWVAENPGEQAAVSKHAEQTQAPPDDDGALAGLTDPSPND